MKIRKQTGIIIVVALLLLGTVGIVAATMIPSAEELLTASLDTLESVTSGHAVVTVSAQLPDQDIDSTFEVWGKLDAGPNLEPAVRAVVLNASHSELIGTTMVSDGSQFWLYSPERNSVIVGQAEELAPLLAERLAEYEGQLPGGSDFEHDPADMPQTPAEAVAKLLEYFTIERKGSDQIGENQADVLRLVPIAEMMPEEIRLAGGFVNLWLRTEDQLPLAVEYAEGAVGAFRAEATQVQINEPIEDSTFSFVIPEGAEVIEAADLLQQMEAFSQPVDAAEVNALTPSELPAGAESVGSDQFAGTVVQRYSLPEGQSFVVAQGTSVPQDIPAEATSSDNVIVRGTEGMLHTNDEATRSLLVWQENDEFFLVGGDLSPEQALAVAESLQ
jgi:outer membrane lipoprotein-sorting protein